MSTTSPKKMSKKRRTPEEIERRHLELGLDEHQLALTHQRVVLIREIFALARDVAVVALMAITIICVLRGSPWPIAAGTVGLGAVTHLLDGTRPPR